MRVITHCPSCQTQFFATEEQLNKHGGKVRCGQCLQVFDAKAQLIAVAEGAAEAVDSGSIPNDNLASDDIAATTQLPAQSAPPDIATETTIANASVENSLENTAAAQPSPAYLSDAVEKTKTRPQYAVKKRGWLWGLGSLLLIILAGLQSVYFLRDEIAIYYPDLKPYLVQACQQLSCSINLPMQIESIMIDDSDMQEDTDHAGVVRFSSTLINQGSHVLAYPNLELTLTDTEDKPVLRRIFKPAEFLPAGINVGDGIRAGEQIRIQLALTTNDTPVAGYRVFVTY